MSERRKGGPLVEYLLVIVCAWSVTWGCRPTPPEPYVPPDIICPTVEESYIADPRKTETTVTWESPQVREKSDVEKIDSVKITTGHEPGDSFPEGPHNVTYRIVDTDGNDHYCHLNFVVIVQRCRVVPNIRSGYRFVNCTNYTYGHECKFGCWDGYKLKGKSRISCQIDGTWSANIPECVALQCQTLKLPVHGLNYTCTDGRNMSSVCWLVCDEDNGYVPVRGQWTECASKKGKEGPLWTNLEMYCKDVEPPTIHDCPAKIIFKTKETGSNMTLVSWPNITAKDNSGETIDVMPDNKFTSPFGGAFPEGPTVVKFSANDSAGNIAECYVIVQVQSVVCDPPNFNDKYLETPDCTDFREGRSCPLRCYLGLNVVARDNNPYITCKKKKTGGREVRGYWDWGQKEEPFCQTHNCTELRSPNYGAMVCDEWFKGSYCQFQCEEGFDLPDTATFTKIYFCSMVTGKWNNEDVPVVPNCTTRHHAKSIKMPEYYYFKGICSTVKDEIKSNFLKALKTKDLCYDKFCTVENVIVRCGDEVDGGFLNFNKKRSALRPRHRVIRRRVGGPRRGSRRRQNRRKSFKAQYISFSVVVPSKKSGSFAENLKYHSRILIGIAKRIARTKFRAGGRFIQATAARVRDAVPICRPGLKIGFFHKDSCVPCLEGSYHNVSRDECSACPLGQYQAKQGQMTCDQCPKGQTTLTLANIDKSACQEMCPPGHYSKNGVVPCAKCPRGTFQMQLNATMCKRCRVGMTTETNGANFSSQCIPYDMLLQGPVSVPVEGNSPSQICDFTFALWIKLVETTYGGVKFEIYSPITGVGLEVTISSHVNIYIGKFSIGRSNNEIHRHHLLT